MWVFYFFASLLIWQGLVSLIGGFRYLSFVRRETSRSLPDFTPFLSVITPCRGLDQGLRENLRALFTQNYPAYEIIFVTDSADDPSLAVIEETRRTFSDHDSPMTRICVAGKAQASGQKVHNLCAAVAEIDKDSQFLIFVDTDARPHNRWLRALVAPLADEGAGGAATGYRWFVPSRGLASQLRAVWNASIASALGARTDRNFCWGGSTAIRRSTFESLDILKEWRGALSDDFALTRALQRAMLPVHFVPGCLTASFEDCTFKELLEFTTRQMKITRVYAPHLWKIVLFSNLAFVLVYYTGLALTITRAALGLPYAVPLILLSLIYALGAGKAYLRLRAVRLALAPYRVLMRWRDLLSHLTLWPLTAILYLYNSLAALFSRQINWRGIAYELKSPSETVIINRPIDNDSVNSKQHHHA
jgi:ceramide glucosyltransferase